jgi:hypothetical protein
MSRDQTKKFNSTIEVDSTLNLATTKKEPKNLFFKRKKSKNMEKGRFDLINQLI